MYGHTNTQKLTEWVTFGFYAQFYFYSPYLEVRTIFSTVQIIYIYIYIYIYFSNRPLLYFFPNYVGCVIHMFSLLLIMSGLLG